MAAAVATAAAISFPGSEATAGLGPRLTGVGVLLPTVFLGLDVLAAVVLEPGVLDGVGLLSLVRLGVFVSTALLAGAFLAVTSDLETDLGVSGFADFDVDEGRVRGDSPSFLAAGVAGLETSFFTGVEFLDVCDADALPPEGVVEVGLEEAGLAVAEGVLGVAGLDATAELLVVPAVGGRVEPVAGRGDAAVLVAGLAVLEAGALSGFDEAAELSLEGAAPAGLGAGGFLEAAAAVVLVLTPLVGAVFLGAAVPVIGFAPLVARAAPVAFFSPTLLLGAGAETVGFLEAAEAGVLFFSRVGVAFFATPLV